MVKCLLHKKNHLMGCTLCNLEEEMNAINLLVAKGDNLFQDRNEPSVAHLMTKLATLMVAKRRLEIWESGEKFRAPVVVGRRDVIVGEEI